MLEAFRAGEFDQIEIIGEADERDFFELCFKEKLLEGLAAEMPTARQKQEIPPCKAGANGFLTKSTQPSKLLEGIEQVLRGGAPMSNHISRKVISAFRVRPNPNPDGNLSPRETEILQALPTKR